MFVDLAEARAAHERGVPRYVERELRAYLACGIHAHGFLQGPLESGGPAASGGRGQAAISLAAEITIAAPSAPSTEMRGSKHGAVQISTQRQPASVVG
jgi:hypothetical protein